MSASAYAGAGFPPPFASPQAAGLCVPNVHGALAALAIPAAAAAAGRMAIPGLAGAGNSVLLVGNLNPERVTPPNLFILFSMYGDVQRVKIVFSKKADGSQAQLAMSHLNGHKLHGKRCASYLQAPKRAAAPRGPGGPGPHQGLREPTPALLQEARLQNFQNIFPPSATLHLSNIPPSISEDDLKILCSSNGAMVKGFKFFQRTARWHGSRWVQLRGHPGTHRPAQPRPGREPPPASVLLQVHYLGPTPRTSLLRNPGINFHHSRK
uniref:RRM domain-containing protein n=1 Tax=Molossus molossus TaxID=27622 RepID=A0A7J8ESN5_MOLMO|nr:hypothetical protein HJG59_008777 [Molossus molossus]